MSKNLTISIDENLLAKFRVVAAEQRTTVNALIRKHMEDATGMSSAAERQRRARKWMAEQASKNMAHDASTPAKDGPSIWNRAEIYAERNDSSAEAA